MAQQKISKTYAEINRKIKNGQAVVVTAEEMGWNRQKTRFPPSCSKY
jgi:hypothetical protein